MRELTSEEIEQASGGILANIGMGLAGISIGLAGYALNLGITGNHSNSQLVGAAVGGFVYGVGGLNHASGIAGTAIGAAVQRGIEDRTDS